MKKFARRSREVTGRPNEENFLGDTLPVTPPLEGSQRPVTTEPRRGQDQIGGLRQHREEKGERTTRLEAIQEEPGMEECVNPERSRPEPQAPEQNKEGERRSERSRKQPKRYGNLITFIPFMLLFMLLCGAMPCGASPRERFVMSGVVFQNLGEVNFSNSEWVAVTEVSFQQVEATLGHLGQWLAEKATEHEGRPQNEDFKIEQLIERATGCLEELRVVKSRFNHLKEAISGKQQRAKRGLIDAGGSALKWLFGVATDRELKELSKHLDSLSKKTSGIVSTLAEQATLVNESLWEVHEHTVVLCQLVRAHQTLEKELYREFHKRNECIGMTINSHGKSG
ncbi:hypothetical protein OUZ56_017409 [Daphnia magna]|uniref:Transmembrane protein n=1 Tax=Daphnia magna TaxID=35525 RepID=A0ABR0ASQ8_9CRUS|nr:hypothetical protein OUZ56_017409 [Daphnia magna]